MISMHFYFENSMYQALAAIKIESFQSLIQSEAATIFWLFMSAR